MNGTLYGTTSLGGAYGFGTIFKLTGKGQETVLYSFIGGTNGETPNSGLVPDGKGNVYGTTRAGGDLSCSLGEAGCGVVYKLSATGKLSVPYRFTGGADGAGPEGVILDGSGNLYGITYSGGNVTSNCRLACGVVYKLDSSGNETPLYCFTGGANGWYPNGLLAMDSAGNLYGATIGGGDPSACAITFGCGVLYKVDTRGNETVLYTFTGGADGAWPNGSLLLDAKGDLFGTAIEGGDLNCGNSISPGCGVAVAVTAAGVEKVMHTFKGPDGATPGAALLRDAAGNFFSTTSYGGTTNAGTVFELNTKGEKVLHSFNGTTDGANPYSGLIMDAKGNL